MKTSPSTDLTPRSPATLEDAQELQAWQAILADERFGLWRAISVAGEAFLVASGGRWAKRSAIAWLALYCLPALGSLAYGLSTHSSALNILGALVASGVILTELLIFILCVFLWPRLVNQALALRRAPISDELPKRRQALALLEQRQHRLSPSLKRAFKHGFGPGIVIVAPLAFLCAGIWIFNALSGSGLYPISLFLSLFGSVFIFGAFFIIGLLLFSGGGLVVVGKQALEHRASIKLLQTTDAAEQIGALELAQAQPDDAGALSLTQEAGSLTEAQHEQR